MFAVFGCCLKGVLLCSSLVLHLLIEKRCQEVDLLCSCVGAGVLVNALIETGASVISGSISRVLCRVFRGL